MQELIELPVEGLTPAMQASLLRELIKQLNIPDDKFEESAKKPPTAEERKEAVLRLNSEINRISEVVQDELKVNSTEIKPITFVNQVNQESSSQAEVSQFTGTTIEPEVLKNPTNKNEVNLKSHFQFGKANNYHFSDSTSSVTSRLEGLCLFAFTEANSVKFLFNPR